MDYELSPGQVSAWRNSNKFLNIWSGSVSSGKTFTWLLLMLHRIMTAPEHGEIVIMGYSTSTVFRNVFRIIETNPLFKGLRDNVHYTKNSDVATIFGRQVHVIGFSNLRATERLQGMTILYSFIDEGVLMPEPVFKMLLTRLRVQGSQCFMTCNPGSSRHYLLTDYIHKAQETNTYYQRFTMDDNPGLPDGYAAQQAALYTGVFYKRFIQGLWVAAEGAVFENFDPAVHVVDELPTMQQVISLGMDYGIKNPTAGVALGLGVDGRLYAMQEWAPEAATDARLRAQLEDWLPTLPTMPRFIYLDPSAKSFAEELRVHNIPNHKANNEVLDGINQLGSLLDSDQLKIHSSCTNLLDELPEYAWDEKARERGEDKPVKARDHFTDALRYAVRSSRHLWQRTIMEPDPNFLRPRPLEEEDVRVKV